MMDRELVSETVDLINPSTRLSAIETFIEFCRRGNFKIYISETNYVTQVDL